MTNILIYIPLSLLVLFALFTVMIRNLLKAVISLAAASASLTIIMFMLNAPLAAVFELSVCAGLITVIFISVISLTKPLTPEEEILEVRKRINRYIYLPVIVIIVALLFLFIKPGLNFSINSSPTNDINVQDVIWNKRPLDILGQIIIILAGVLGVVILFKESKK
jgi:NADH-quinone oxidoreductase subunit J